MTNKIAMWHNLSKHTKISNTSQMKAFKRGNMEKIIATKNLEGHRAENPDGKFSYVIVEKSTSKPIMAIDRQGLTNVFEGIEPVAIQDYKHYDQILEITKEILKMEGIK